MDLGLSGKRVIVTGGSKGIGRAIAHTFLDEGATVAICARNHDQLAATAAELSEFGDVHHHQIDMAAKGDPTAFVDWASDAMGGLDVVVSNVSAMACTDWEALVNVDLVRTNELIRAALAKMPDHADANIVCIGSTAASIAAPRIAAYAAVKAVSIPL